MIVKSVVVVGSGPAGSVAAIELSRRGHDVLMVEKGTFPRDKACGDGLTRHSVAVLERLGLRNVMHGGQPIGGVGVVVRDGPSRVTRYEPSRDAAASGAVLSRREFDERLAKRAVASGAELREGTRAVGPVIESGRVTGIRVVRGAREETIRARFVVAADGAPSRLARQLGAAKLGRDSTGFAMRGYFGDVRGLESRFEFRVPIHESGTGRTLAGYAWVFPLPGGVANIGVGFFPSQKMDADLNMRRLYESVIAELVARDSRFSDMRPIGRAIGAPLDSGFTPARVMSRGVLFVGDAAGLVDPFTGEGIDAALESGRLAANVIDEALQRPDSEGAILEEYGGMLEQRYGARFRTGRRHVKSHVFLWKLLANACDVRRPLFQGLRAAVIDYGSSADLPVRPHLDFLPSAALEEVDRVDREIAESTCAQFPLLGKVADNILDHSGRLLRTILVMLVGRCGPSTPEQRIAAAMVVELAYLGHLAHQDVLEEGDNGRRPSPSAILDSAKSRINWCNMFAVMSGDYFLVEAYRLSASGLGAAATRLLAAQGARVSELKLRELDLTASGALTAEGYLGFVVPQTAAFYETAALLAAGIAGWNEGHTCAIAELARCMGASARLAADAPRNGRNERPSAEPCPLGAADALARARQQKDRALTLLIDLPHEAPRAQLARLVEYA